MSQEQKIAAVLAWHRVAWIAEEGYADANVEVTQCSCGLMKMSAEYPAHLAAVLAPLITASQAEALREAADAAEGMHEPAAPDCKEWAVWLRTRATHIEGRALVQAIHDRKAQG